MHQKFVNLKLVSDVTWLITYTLERLSTCEYDTAFSLCYLTHNRNTSKQMNTTFLIVFNCMFSVQTHNSPWLLLCDHQSSPTWSHRLLDSAGTSQVPVACCRTPPAIAGAAEEGGILRVSRHTGGLSPCQSEGDWPFEPPDIPKWTETKMWYLTDPHRGIFFSLASQCKEDKAQGEL